ncbi:hypothetical protein BH24ACT9_BH24ACT9_13680 [soil metagenome]
MGGGANYVAMTPSSRAQDANVGQRRDARPPWNEDVGREHGSVRPRGADGGTAPARRGFVLTGLSAVAFIFVVTLGVATLESLLGIGLRTLTLLALSVSTLLAGLWVRRSDIVTIVVAPPLVFATVAALEIVLAPTLKFTPTVLASILVRGFPTMSIAAAIALLVCGYRLLKHR